MLVRDATADDWPTLWRLVQQVLSENDTYAWPADLDEAAARVDWLAPWPGRTRVAVVDDRVVGAAKMGPNRPGPGSHVGTASFLVDRDARGGGIGRRLVVDTLERLREDGYAAVQFNAVAASNVHAVRLYEDLGFSVVGTVPEAFEHPRLGRVGLHVMHRTLD